MPHFTTAAASYREASEDRTLIFQLAEHWIVGVADGAGGASGGARASTLFVMGVRRAVESGALDVWEPTAWMHLLKALDEEIAGDAVAGETTGIALAVTPTSIVGASAGDSRAWLFTDDSLELTRNQARKPRLGTGRSAPEPFTAPARGTLVAGTDGLFDHARLEDIRAIALAAAVDDAANALVHLPRARSRTLPDDVAVVVGWLDGQA